MAPADRLWNSFCSMLEKIDTSVTDEERFYTHIVNWLSENKKLFDVGTWNIYKLDYYFDLKLSLYRVDCMECSVEETISRLINLSNLTDFKVGKKSSILMFIRDILWDMVAFKTQTPCPNCQNDDLRALIEPNSNEMILSCDKCCWSQSIYGDKWSGTKLLIPANKEQISKFF